MTVTAGTINVWLKANGQQFNASMKRSQRALAGFKSSLMGLGVASTAGFAGLALAGKKLANLTADFERGMVRAGAIARASAKEQAALTKAALNLSATTEFTGRQVAQAMGNLAQKGFDAVKIIDAMPGTLQLASAAQIDVADAASIASAAMNAYKLEAKDLARVNDALVAASNNAAIDVPGIGHAFQYVGSVGKSFRIELEEMVAALGVLGSAGIPAEMAGTALKRIIPAVSGARSASGKAKEIFDELGLTALSVAHDGFPPLIDIVRTVERAIRNSGDEAAVSAQLMQVFGQRAGPALTALVNQGSDALSKLTREIKGSGGVAEEISRKQLDTLWGTMKIVASQAERLAITFGNRLRPTFERIGGAISGAIGWFERLPDAMQGTIARTLAYVTGIMGAMTATSLLVTVLGPLVKVLLSVGRLLGVAFTKPILAAAAGLAGIVLIIGSVKTAWNANLGGIRDIWESTTTAIRSALDRMDQAFVAFAESDTMKGVYKKLSSGLTDILDRLEVDQGSFARKFAAALSLAGDGDAMPDGGIGELLSPNSKGAQDLLQNAKDLGQQAKQDIIDTFKEGLTTVKDLFGPLGEIGLDVAEGVIGEENFRSLQGALEAATKRIEDLVHAIRTGSVAGGNGGPGNFDRMGVMRTMGVLDMSFAAVAERSAFVADMLNKFGDELKDSTVKAKKSADRWVQGLQQNINTLNMKGIVPSVDTSEGGNGFDPGMLDLGGLGQMASTVTAAFSAAGPIGALVALIFALISGAQQFQEALQHLSDTVGILGNAIGEYFTPFKTLLGSVRVLVNSAVKPLKKFFNALGDQMRAFAPVLMLVGMLFELLGLILLPFEAAVRALGFMLEMVMRAIFYVLRPIIFVVLAIARAIASVWNAILDAIIWVLRQIGKIPFFGDIADKAADSLEKLRVNTDGLSDAMDSLNIDNFGDAFDPADANATFDQFMDTAEAVGNLGDAATDVAEELKNVPDGFKIALRRFQSQSSRLGSTESGIEAGNARGGQAQVTATVRAYANGGFVDRPTLAVVGEAGPEHIIPEDVLKAMGGMGGTTIQTGPITVMSNDPDDMFEQLRQRTLRDAQLQTGIAAPMTPRYVGETG